MKAHLHVVLARERQQVGNFVFVMTAHDDGVYLIGSRPDCFAAAIPANNPIQHIDAVIS